MRIEPHFVSENGTSTIKLRSPDQMQEIRPEPRGENNKKSRFQITKTALVPQAVEGSVGLPVGVQVVAPWYEDEMCLRVMREVEAAADFHVSNA